MPYRLGTPVVIAVELKQDGEFVDPAALVLVVTRPDETLDTFVYSVDDELIRDDEGRYHLEYDPDDEGRYTYDWNDGDDPLTTFDAGAFDVVAATTGTTAYALRVDVENVYGPTNVAKWADLDNDQEAAHIQNRIEWACSRATDEINDRLRGGPYDVPFTSPFPSAVVDACARLAGCLLYESRGITDADEDGESSNAVAPHRKRVDRWYREVLSGIRTIGGFPDATNAPRII